MQESAEDHASPPFPPSHHWFTTKKRSVPCFVFVVKSLKSVSAEVIVFSSLVGKGPGLPEMCALVSVYGMKLETSLLRSLTCLNIPRFN